jgi:tetratricopeptide (TPR) repeat protein
LVRIPLLLAGALGLTCSLHEPLHAAALQPQVHRTITLHCDEAASSIGTTSFSETLLVETAVASSATLEIEETGTRVSAHADPPSSVHTISVPPRFGWTLVDLLPGTSNVRLEHPPHEGGTASPRLTLHCAPDERQLARLAWLRNVAAIDPKLQSALKKDAHEALLSQIDFLAGQVPSERLAGLPAHLRAQAYSWQDKSSDAIRQFGLAEESWQRTQQSGRALAARVGRVENIQKAGVYSTVMDLTGSLSALKGGDGYYPVRLRSSRCLALRYLGRRNEADSCYQTVITALRQMREIATYVSIVQDLALLKVELGDLDEAEKLGRDVLPQVEGPDAPVIRGRILLMLSDLDAWRGNIAQSIDGIRSAIREFGSQNSVRWEANAYLKLAMLYGRLGAVVEAKAAVASALSRLSMRDAPARVAAALTTFARITGEAGNPAEGIPAADLAELIDGWLGIQSERDAARSTKLSLLVQSGDLQGARFVLRRSAEVSPMYRTSWNLAKAKLDLADGKLNEVRAALEASSEHTQGERLQRLELQASLLAREGHPDRALALIERAAKDIQDIRDRTGNPLLRHVGRTATVAASKSGIPNSAWGRDSSPSRRSGSPARAPHPGLEGRWPEQPGKRPGSGRLHAARSFLRPGGRNLPVATAQCRSSHAERREGAD